MLDHVVALSSGVQGVVLSNLHIRHSRFAGVLATGAVDCMMSNCSVGLVGGMGVNVSGGTNFTAVGIEVFGAGAGGVLLDSGERSTLTSSGHRLVNSTVHGVSRWVYAMVPSVRICSLPFPVCFNRESLPFPVCFNRESLPFPACFNRESLPLDRARSPDDRSSSAESTRRSSARIFRTTRTPRSGCRATTTRCKTTTSGDPARGRSIAGRCIPDATIHTVATGWSATPSRTSGVFGEYTSRCPMPLRGLHCQVSKLFNSDACPNPTTGAWRGTTRRPSIWTT